MREELQLPLFLLRNWRPRTVPDVENVHIVVAFIYRVDNSVDAWFLPTKQMAKFLSFRNDCTVLRKWLQTVNLAGQIIEPCKGAFGGFRINEFLDGSHVSQGAVGQSNEVRHACAGTFPEPHAPDAHAPSLCLRGLAGFLQAHRPVRQCRAGADRDRKSVV